MYCMHLFNIEMNTDKNSTTPTEVTYINQKRKVRLRKLLMVLTKQLCRSTLHWTAEINFYLELQRPFCDVIRVPTTLLTNSTNCRTAEPQLQFLTASRIR